jgi:ABC transport system ATP-binding/permease protein
LDFSQYFDQNLKLWFRTYMSLLIAKDLELKFVQKTIFKDLNLSILEGKIIALVGVNGSGKTSLIKILAGVLEPDSGQIFQSSDLTKYYLPQDFIPNINQTCNQYLDTDLDLKLEQKQAYYERVEVLKANFNIPDFTIPFHQLSGGQQRQLLLLKALSLQPDLLLLDEPTNHLDLITLINLQNVLKSYTGTILLISHDRYFIDHVATGIWELEQGKLYQHYGNYSVFLNNQRQRRQQHNIQYQRAKQELNREREWVIAGVKARGTKDQGRLKRYDELKSWVESNKPNWQKPYLPIPKSKPLGNKILNLKEVSVHFPHNQKSLVDNLNLEFQAGQRIGLLGPNGSGKTTLLQAILDILPHQKGKISIGQNTDFNYQDQKRLEVDDALTVIQTISEGSIEMKFGDQKTNVFAYMKKFAFTSDDLKKPVGVLSGGQRARLLLAKILKLGGNFLILDEPTNDLDVDTMEALENTLVNFAGCVLLVSHDRFFLDRVCTDVIALEGDGDYTISTGGYSSYIQKYGSEKDFWQHKKNPNLEVSQVLQETTKPRTDFKAKYQAKEFRKIRVQLRQIEKELETITEKIKAKEIQISHSQFYIQRKEKITSELDKLEKMKQTRENLENQWLEKSAKLDN